MDQKSKKKCLLYLSVIAAFTLIGVLFSVLCAGEDELGLLQKYDTLLDIVLCISPFSLTVLSVLFYFKKMEVACKLTVILYILLDFILILFFFLLSSGFMTVVDDPEHFQQYLESAGSWMGALFVVLQFLQVIVLPIPSFVTLVAGTILFGAGRCFLYSYFAIVVGSIIAFYIGKFLGYKAVCWLVGKETLDVWMKKIKGKDYFLLTAMFILPFFPDDVLCFVAGISSITPRYFIVMIILVRAFTIATTCFPIDLIPFTGWGLAVWAFIFLAVIVAFFLFCKYQDRFQLFLGKIKKKFQKNGKNNEN